MTCKTCGDRRTVTIAEGTCQPERQAPCPVCVGTLIASLPPATDPAIPDGWKLVPIEPTEAMIAAWESACPAVGWDALQDMSDEDSNRALVRAEWYAMLAAAPTIPATGEAGVPEKLEGCPTPWCDSDEQYVWQGSDDRFHVICGGCQVEGPGADDEPSARIAWDTRAPTEPVKGEG